MSSLCHDALPVYEYGYGLGVGAGVFLTFGHKETRSVAGCVIARTGSKAAFGLDRGFEESLWRPDLKYAARFLDRDRYQAAIRGYKI